MPVKSDPEAASKVSTEKIKKQETAQNRVVVDIDRTPPISGGNEKFEENMDLEDLLLKSKSAENIEGYDSDELREKEHLLHQIATILIHLSQQYHNSLKFL